MVGFDPPLTILKAARQERLRLRWTSGKAGRRGPGGPEFRMGADISTRKLIDKRMAWSPDSTLEWA